MKSQHFCKIDTHLICFVRLDSMDLQVYLIIVTVFFVSLGSLLFVNRQLRGGKTFEEALAEKRQLTEKLYGTNKKKNATKKTNAAKKV